MGFKVRKSQDGDRPSKYVKTKVLREYPLIIMHTARTGERPGYNNQGIQDYIVGDFVAFDAGGKKVFEEYGAMWSINRTQKGGHGPMFRALHEHGVYVGRIGLRDLPNGNTMNAWEDTDPDSVKAQLDEALTLFEKNGTEESEPSTMPAQSQEQPPVVQQPAPQLQRPW